MRVAQRKLEDLWTLYTFSLLPVRRKPMLDPSLEAGREKPEQ